MNHQSIPHEAVEAALLTIARPDHWLLLDDEAKVRDILEAAAPHMGVDVLEEWAVQFASGAVEEADGRKDAERKLREIRECIADGIETPALEPMTVVHRYRIEESELTQWKRAAK